MKGAGWLGFFREFNIRVTRVWCETKSASNLYIKTAQHLSKYGNKLLLQASQAEVNQITSAITGLPATASAFTALQPPAISQEPSGSGGARKGSRQCPSCSMALGLMVPRRGHNCVLYVISRGQQRSEHPHTRDKVSTMARLPTLLSQ